MSEFQQIASRLNTSCHLTLVCNIEDDESFLLIDSADANYTYSPQTGDVQLSISGARIGLQVVDTISYDNADVRLNMTRHEHSGGDATFMFQSGARVTIGDTIYGISNLSLEISIAQ